MPKAATQKILQHAGLRVTSARLAVCQTLAAHGPCSAADLAKHCANFDRATVYRTIGTLETAGLIHRLWHGFKSTLELGEAFHPHHHHLTCEKCGATIDLQSAQLETMLENIATMHSFRLTYHSVELAGLCIKCQPH